MRAERRIAELHASKRSRPGWQQLQSSIQLLTKLPTVSGVSHSAR